MTKLLLAERRLGRACKKVIVVGDRAAVSYICDGWDGWDGEFAREFGIEFLPVSFDAAVRRTVFEAQERQRR